jgi:hypothetical protein
VMKIGIFFLALNVVCAWWNKYVLVYMHALWIVSYWWNGLSSSIRNFFLTVSTRFWTLDLDIYLFIYWC